jgi:hypothetical protein
VHYIDSGDKSYLFTEAYHRTVMWSMNKWLYWNEMIVFCSHAFCVLALKWWICCNLSLWCGSKLYFRGIFRFWIHVSSIFLYFHSLGPNFSTIFSSPGSTIFLTCFYHRKKWSLSYLAFSIAGHFARGYRVEFSLWKIFYHHFSLPLKHFFRPCSGRIVHRFIPIGKILKPVLLECVSPVTCYWSLSLLLRGEAELMLVFEVYKYFAFQTWISNKRFDWLNDFRRHELHEIAGRGVLQIKQDHVWLLKTKDGRRLRIFVVLFLNYSLKLHQHDFHVQELRPPVKMLIPIWKALCDASGIKEGSDTWKDAN